MPWLKLRLRADKAQAQVIADTLENLGALAVSLEDAGDEPQFDLGQPEAAAWSDTWVSGLFPIGTSPLGVLEQLARDTALSPLPPHDVELVADEDWERSWMERYEPLRFGQRLWVCPSWLTPPDPSAVTIMLDPGLAFGSGTHATTALCLEWLERQSLTGKTVIDYGCGSGILAIAAVKLGARAAWGIDTDPQALAVSRENAARNGIGSELTLLLPEQAPAGMIADIVLANILAKPLMELAGRLKTLVRPSGGLALSGLLANQTEEVSRHYVQDFDLTVEIRDDWALLRGVRRVRES